MWGSKLRPIIPDNLYTRCPSLGYSEWTNRGLVLAWGPKPSTQLKILSIQLFLFVLHKNTY